MIANVTVCTWWNKICVIVVKGEWAIILVGVSFLQVELMDSIWWTLCELREEEDTKSWFQFKWNSCPLVEKTWEMKELWCLEFIIFINFTKHVYCFSLCKLLKHIHFMNMYYCSIWFTGSKDLSNDQCVHILSIFNCLNSFDPSHMLSNKK